MPPKSKKDLTVETLRHAEATRKNLPTAELETVMEPEQRRAVRVEYERRNRDLDPQLVWRGKDEQDWSDLVVQAPPLFIQEKVHPKVLIDDLLRQTRQKRAEEGPEYPDLFADFNGLPEKEAATEFYTHDAHWQNRMILGDSLSVMASLAEREGLRGKVQAIYFDPPYGIKFNSNFQWSTTSRDVKDGDRGHITREPEQVKAFRDTWRDGIHSYLTYLRDRLTVARDLLTDSGSIFVQIGDENVHRVRAVMDEVFGEDNFCGLITYQKTSSANSPVAKVNTVASVSDYIIWYAKSVDKVKYRQLYNKKDVGSIDLDVYGWILNSQGVERRITREEKENPSLLKGEGKLFCLDNFTSTGWSESLSQPIDFQGKKFSLAGNLHWKTHPDGCERLIKAGRLIPSGKALRYKRFSEDFPVFPITNTWQDTGTGSFTDEKVYVVQTSVKAVQRCILMSTDPGDLVLDPTCGSGTTAYAAEHWGRRWITIDTSRVSLALARARIMGARYPYYLLADTPEGQRKEAEVTRSGLRLSRTAGDIRLGFVYERIPHIKLGSVANNPEIDVIWDRYFADIESIRLQLNDALGVTWESWEIPGAVSKTWPESVCKLHELYWQKYFSRQREIDASIVNKANDDCKYLFDRPYEDKGRVRVAGPFTVESLSPHRVLAVDQDDELVDLLDAAEGRRKAAQRDEADFAATILENLKSAGVQQAHKDGRISFTSLTGWPGRFIAAEGRYVEDEQEAGRADGTPGKPAKERRAGIFIGPEFGTVARADLVAAAREAADAGFDVVIACAFNFDAHSAEFDRLGRVPVLKARMNPDLHMGKDLKATGAGNLFTLFGEPDVDIQTQDDGRIVVQIRGVDFFKAGNIHTDDTSSIAVWFIDTDYNEESFFVRHAYFLGQNDPYKALKTTLKAEIDADAWATLNSDTSRPFDKPRSGRIAVKVINHLGDEVMKVFSVG